MVNDKVNTAKKIALASGLPLSLTIIGVGAADFATVCNYIPYDLCASDYVHVHTYIYV